MIHVEINNITKVIGYDLFPKKKVTIKSFNYDFEDGKCYCLAYKDFSGYLISLIIAGEIKNKKISITSDEKNLFVDLKEQAILMGIEKKSRESNKVNLLKCAKDGKLFERYGISEQRLFRKMKNMGSERWRVSFALGEVLRKKIFCFPWISPEIVNMYSHSFLFDFVKEAKSKGCIIIIPTMITDINKILFDEILE